MSLRHIVLGSALLLPSCVVQTETLEGERGSPGEAGQSGETGATGATGQQGDPGVAPFTMNPDGSIYYVDGNVGVGTKTPAVRLQVSAGGSYAPGDEVACFEAGDSYSSKTGIVSVVNPSVAQNTEDRQLLISTNEIVPSGNGQYSGLIEARSGGISRFIVKANGNTGVGIDAPGVALDVNGTVRASSDVLAYGYTMTETINVRSWFRKSEADVMCTSSGGTASYVPWGWRGKTGSEICAADVHGATQCKAVVFVFSDADNKTGGNSQWDLTCSDQVDYPWPWGVDYAQPDTFSGEYFHGNTFVVCCQ